MKLRKQGGLKAVITAAVAGLMLLFLNLVKQEPMTTAAADEPSTPAPDYNRFFAPGTTATPSTAPSVPAQPHTRSRAS